VTTSPLVDLRAESPGAAGQARRSELAAFLRSRRDRLAPEAVGLPRGTRRRAPGLRREEVAQLAGVGVTWYTWLEQGRSINVSAQVLSAIARALRLSADERDHMFTLAGLPSPATERDEDVLTEALRAIVDNLEPLPAHVVTPRYDLLAWNQADARLLGDFGALPPERRNVLWLLFTEPAWRDMYGGWDGETARQTVARFRRSFAAHVDDPSWQGLVDELSERSSEFSDALGSPRGLFPCPLDEEPRSSVARPQPVRLHQPVGRRPAGRPHRRVRTARPAGTR
jgi:transcriptional regulator with XRE-family HTH domain